MIIFIIDLAWVANLASLFHLNNKQIYGQKKNALLNVVACKILLLGDRRSVIPCGS